MAPCVGAAQDSVRVAIDSAAAVRVGVLRPGDVLRINVYREADFSGPFLIDARGNVQIPGLGDIQATGLSPVAVKERLRERLIARGISNPELSVEPLIRVSVLGEVRQPGIVEVEPGTSLLQLLARAGGPTEQAALRESRVIREGRSVQIDLLSALSGAATGRYVLYSNDVLVIPRRRSLNRETIAFVLNSMTALLSVATFIVTVSR